MLKSFLTGKPIDEIVGRWEGEISRDAIVEALNLSINALEQFHNTENK